MEREEIKQKLYNVAEIIRNNADKFANGEILTNEDWLQGARDFNACMNYLANSDDFEGTRKDLEPFETQKPEVTYRFIVITRNGSEAVVYNCEHTAVNRIALFDYIFKRYGREQIETVTILSESKE